MQPLSGLVGRTLLLVVRESRTADELACGLAATGVRLLFAYGAQDALMILRGETVDAVACELELDDGDELHLIRRIRARSSVEGGATPAVALLSATSQRLETRALLAGYQLSVPVGAPVGKLAVAIAEVLAREIDRASQRGNLPREYPEGAPFERA